MHIVRPSKMADKQHDSLNKSLMLLGNTLEKHA